jgi:hypothetical protein
LPASQSSPCQWYSLFHGWLPAAPLPGAYQISPHGTSGPGRPSIGHAPNSPASTPNRAQQAHRAARRARIAASARTASAGASHTQ